MLLPLLLALSLQDQFVRPPVQVDVANPGSAKRAAGDMEDHLAAVAWVEGSTGGEHLWCASSRDGGLTWAARVQVDADPAGADKTIRGRSVLVTAGQVFACWQDARNGLDDLYFRASRDGGRTWGPEQRLDDGGAPGQLRVGFFRMQGDPAGGVLAIALRIEGGGGGEAVRLLRSLDGGRSFQPASVLHQGGTVASLDLALEAPALHVAWQDDTSFPGVLDVRYQRSDDLGATWLPAPLAITAGMATDPRDLAIAADGARVAVAWQEVSALCAIAVNVSNDGGDHWLPFPRRVAGSVSPACVPQNPRLLLLPGRLLVAWADDRFTAGLRTPWLAWTADSGQTWTEHQLLPAPGWEPCLQGDPARGLFAVQWHGGAQVYASISRAAAPEPGPAFVVDSAASATLDGVRLRRDPVYPDHLSVWMEQDASGRQHVWAAGFRAANVVPEGAFQAGQPVRFRAAGFPHDEAGQGFQVLVSAAPGAAPLPAGDGRSTGLAPHPWLALSAQEPRLRGTLLAGGGGVTPLLPFPPSIPPGTTLHFAAVSFRGGPLGFGAITDVRTLQVQ